MRAPTIPPVLVESLTRVQGFFQSSGVPVYLVGGIVRDQLLGRSLGYLNVDLAVPAGALLLSRDLAAHVQGAFVPLDEVAGSARVVVTAQGERVELDVSDFRGPTLEEDLRRRDFTINAMAIALTDWLRAPHSPQPLIDPLEGRRALQRRELQACFPGTFEQDPVRILRAFRFAAQLEFTLDPSLFPLMARALPLLPKVSGERIRDELMAVFETDRAHVAIQTLNQLGGLDAVFPELSAGRGMEQGGVHHLDVLDHQIETVAQADRFLSDFAEFSEPLRVPLSAYCREELVERRSRKSLIKLAGLLHDVGKPARRTVEADGEIWFIGHEESGAELVGGVAERLRLSNRETDMVRQLVLHHLRPGFLSREPQLTRRAVYRFFKDLGDDGPGCLLTWWADRMAARGAKSRLDQIAQQRERLEELLNAYFFTAEEVVKPPRLLDGRQLMRQFKLSPGPLVGTLLAAIEEAQAEGRIRTRDEALALARAQLEQRKAP
ncbi:MAG: CCA tRNA nucleotidyltransferase [Candidatus Omnitrophica bacterium]|nr:CCA tRNA nucleotidyltransferase [Candidatus Omnitrophota bacterium]MBI2495152.1 CCA tRNA nucleotidyltransferase [Candidatus Omnitrophota bacterium]MBI3021111.1 CCA tRNA nucleotidyltransferase [Candidatus Omnitrophota bacterium]MBI3083115.1 CCA tRNA nucleotidyltransferase [Candidatus Omnitrophota bacterium]